MHYVNGEKKTFRAGYDSYNPAMIKSPAPFHCIKYGFMVRVCKFEICDNFNRYKEKAHL